MHSIFKKFEIIEIKIKIKVKYQLTKLDICDIPTKPSTIARIF